MVQRILTDLSELSGRDFKAELARGLPVYFWTRMIGILWDAYLEELQVRPKGAERNIALIWEKLRAARRLVNSGGGAREGRELDPLIKAEVKERAGGCCCHCGGTDMPDALSQICHFKRHARAGPFHLDNLGWGHRSCDGAFDGGEIIHDFQLGGYWTHPRRGAGAPDMRQRAFIADAYITDRWEDHKAVLCPDGDLRVWMRSEGYEHRT